MSLPFKTLNFWHARSNPSIPNHLWMKCHQKLCNKTWMVTIYQH
jgi:hypothetical protein